MNDYIQKKMLRQKSVATLHDPERFSSEVGLLDVLIVGFEILRENREIYLPPSVEKNGILSTSSQVVNWFKSGKLSEIDPLSDLDKISVHHAFKVREWVFDMEDLPYIKRQTKLIFQNKMDIKYSEIPFVIEAIDVWNYIVGQIEGFCRESIWIGVIGQSQTFFGKVIKTYLHDTRSTFLEWRIRDISGNLIAFIERKTEFDRLEVELGDCLSFIGTPQEHFLSVEDGHTRCTRLSPDSLELVKNYGKPK